jgi:predicted TIM-barrel fold metal-dependent hydrolase
VFDRHPSLRFGVIEVGSFWIGPLASQLDMWCAHNQLFSKTKVVPLSMKPSEFIRRNVRVTAFDFELVDEYIDRYGLEDVYCYASDFPHMEGGKDPMGFFAKRLARLGPEVMEKFFVKNGEWLMPG